MSDNEIPPAKFKRGQKVKIKTEGNLSMPVAKVRVREYNTKKRTWQYALTISTDETLFDEKDLILDEEETNNKPANTKDDYFSIIPEVINMRINTFSVNNYDVSIFVLPQWHNDQLNDQYTGSISASRDNYGGPATWIQSMWFGIGLPFLYNDDQYGRSFPFRMIQTNEGIPKRNALTLSASQVPDLPDYRQERHPNWENEQIGFIYYDYKAILHRSEEATRGARTTHCEFRVQFEVPIPNSVNLEQEAVAIHEQQQDIAQDVHEVEQELFFREIPEYQRKPYLREIFDARQFWAQQHVTQHYSNQQLLDLRARWKEHFIQLIPQACALLLPKSTTAVKTKENQNPNYKLTKIYDTVLEEDYWRIKLQTLDITAPNNNNPKFTEFLVKVQNNVPTPLSTAYSIVKVKEPDLKF
jgi:hypothetical protein